MRVDRVFNGFVVINKIADPYEKESAIILPDRVETQEYGKVILVPEDEDVGVSVGDEIAFFSGTAIDVPTNKEDFYVHYKNIIGTIYAQK